MVTPVSQLVGMESDDDPMTPGGASDSSRTLTDSDRSYYSDESMYEPSMVDSDMREYSSSSSDSDVVIISDSDSETE